MPPKVLVTGATGNIGYDVVKDLLKKRVAVKAAVRDVQRDSSRFKGLEVEVVPFDFLKPDTFEPALEDVDRLFLMRPPKLAKPQTEMKPFFRVLKKDVISQIVFVSLMGVEKNPVVPHRKIENMIKASKIPFTFLRPGFFMQNLNTTHREDIAIRNELFIPVGRAKTSFIDTRDIAAVAAVCLSSEGHLGKSYTLTGAKAFNYYEIADILSNILGRKIEYKNPSLLQFRRTIIRRGIPEEFANVMTMLYFITRLGTAEKVTTDVKNILGRDPISFEQYAMDFQSFWNE
ncbi:SDR family oxidoreductase [Ammoniphilus sp. CFH 90114]|uniref:SDR family oxidoreductase n=1 Tax=Ammoniphilus sp. CFH 90114 TaxID=2493665 RepID=UPI00100E10C2|nr:SDR family oxidoreductase [Ammoniphilus sp. CFH 90114]RXT07287.1 SDR family oxidoreductase [Ammoniphilus sp. CFH 90114]